MYATIVFADVNECDLETDGCAHYCENTDGSFNCSCREGFELEDDGKNCAGWSACKRTL